MSQENVVIVVGAFEDTNARDFAAVMDAYADDIVVALHGELRSLAGDGAVGKEAVGQWFGDWFKTFDPDYRFEIEEAHDLGSQVLLVGTHHGRGRASGAPVTAQAGWIYTLRAGKIIRCDLYPAKADAFEASGLSE